MHPYNYERSGRQRRNRREIDGPLCVSSIISDANRLTNCTQTTIRVRFSDRTQLEKTFPSTDKIRSVYAFVRSSLRDDVKHIKFILCSCVWRFWTVWALTSFVDQSPPKRDLLVSDPNVRDLSLVELQLSPSSVLLLRFTDESLNGRPIRREVVRCSLQGSQAPMFLHRCCRQLQHKRLSYQPPLVLMPNLLRRSQLPLPQRHRTQVQRRRYPNG